MSRSNKSKNTSSVPQKWKQIRRAKTRQKNKQALINGKDTDPDRKSDQYNYW